MDAKLQIARININAKIALIDKHHENIEMSEMTIGVRNGLLIALRIIDNAKNGICNNGVQDCVSY